jgi:AraC-like DNA-binding protein
LTLPVLARQLDCSPNHLSQVINEKLNENFFDFVNRHRIEEAKRLLTQDERPQKILAIALDTGFNSKSAFYNAFKKQVHMTPAQYRSHLAEAA